MNEQEEIRKGIEQTIKNNTAGYVHLSSDNRASISKDIISYLHRNDVVIKVDRELPKTPYDTAKDFLGDLIQGYTQGEQDMLKAGYVATTPIIEESK